MNRYLINLVFISIVFFTDNLIAQDYYDFVRPQKQSRFSIGLMASPDYEGRFFHAEKDPDKELNKELRKQLKENENAGFGYSAGIHFLYDLNQRWFMRLGIYYSEKTLRANGFVTGIYPDSVFTTIKTDKNKSKFSFLEIPLTFHYMLNKPYDKSKNGTCYTSYSQYNRKKPLFYLFFGPAYSVNMSDHEFDSRRWTSAIDSTFSNTDEIYADNYAINHLGIYLGAGYLRYFNKHLFLTVEPTFRFFPARWYSKKFRESEEPESLPHSLKASTFHVRDMPWSIGLQIAINYHF